MLTRTFNAPWICPQDTPNVVKYIQIHPIYIQNVHVHSPGIWSCGYGSMKTLFTFCIHQKHWESSWTTTNRSYSGAPDHLKSFDWSIPIQHLYLYDICIHGMNIYIIRISEKIMIQSYRDVYISHIWKYIFVCIHIAFLHMYIYAYVSIEYMFILHMYIAIGYLGRLDTATNITVLPCGISYTWHIGNPLVFRWGFQYKHHLYIYIYNILHI